MTHPDLPYRHHNPVSTDIALEHTFRRVVHQLKQHVPIFKALVFTLTHYHGIQGYQGRGGEYKFQPLQSKVSGNRFQTYPRTQQGRLIAACVSSDAGGSPARFLSHCCWFCGKPKLVIYHPQHTPRNVLFWLTIWIPRMTALLPSPYPAVWMPGKLLAPIPCT